MFLKRFLTGALVAAATLTSVAGAPVRAPRVVTVVIEKATFESITDKLTVGDVVEWVNKDIVDHTATAKNKDWDVAIPTGKKARVTLKKAGTVDYFCRYHPNMTARLVIVPAK